MEVFLQYCWVLLVVEMLILLLMVMLGPKEFLMEPTLFEKRLPYWGEPTVVERVDGFGTSRRFSGRHAQAVHKSGQTPSKPWAIGLQTPIVRTGNHNQEN